MARLLMKKNIFKISIILVGVGVLALCSLLFLFNRTTGGIPHAIYSRIDDNGDIVNEGSEGSWIIRKDEAEHRYLIFHVVNIGEKIYFEIEIEQQGSLKEEESGLFQYEVTYDKKSQILSVSMTSSNGQPYYIPTREFDWQVFQFRKTGFVIG
jgi:hypothetical protein